MAEFHIADTVDITDVVCPVTFVKAKVAIEELDDGDILDVHMNDGEPVQNVPRSMKEEGHQILKLIDNKDGTYDLIVKKVGETKRIRIGIGKPEKMDLADYVLSNIDMMSREQIDEAISLAIEKIKEFIFDSNEEI